MTTALSSFVEWTVRLGAMAIIANEIRGLILAMPVLYAMYQAGGSLMAIWLGFCSLGGIALSVIIPIVAAKRMRPVIARLKTA